MDKRVEFAKAVTISNKSHHEKNMDTAAIQETNRQIEHIMQKRSYARRTRQTTMQQALSEEHDVLMQAAQCKTIRRCRSCNERFRSWINVTAFRCNHEILDI